MFWPFRCCCYSAAADVVVVAADVVVVAATAAAAAAAVTFVCLTQLPSRVCVWIGSLFNIHVLGR